MKFMFSGLFFVAAVTAGLSGCASADQPASENGVGPHSHMRDSKGIWVPEKKGVESQQPGTSSSGASPSKQPASPTGVTASDD